MQKRIVLVLAILFIASVAMFAQDGATTTTSDDLFAGVDGSALTAEEMVKVKGEGIPEGVWRLIASADNQYIEIPGIVIAMTPDEAKPLVRALQKQIVSYRLYKNDKSGQVLIIAWTNAR